MTLDVDEVVRWDGRRYLCIAKTNYEGIDYYLVNDLVQDDDFGDITLILKPGEGNNLTLVDDPQLCNEIAPILSNNLNKVLIEYGKKEANEQGMELDFDNFINFNSYEGGNN